MDTQWPALVRRLRFVLAVTQLQLAQRLGVERATVSRWTTCSLRPCH
jgi:transcriptional regulator with XRE-family HTH domain